MQKGNERQIKQLIDGLKKGNCILFLGPELIKFNGKDYNTAFYETLEDDDKLEDINKKSAKYDEKEKLWTFQSLPVKREFFYVFDDYFKENRNLNNPIFHKLVSMPFPLIVSLLPDSMLDTVYSQYEKFHYTFCSLLDDKIPEVTPDKTVIYNIYGNIENQDYICSHFDYMNFIINHGNTSDLPGNLTSAIKKANYLIFIGFKMDKWYNIILMYILNKIKEGQKKYVIEEQNVKELIQKLSDKSLNLMFIENNSEQFIDQIYQKAKEHGILRNVIPKIDYLKETIKSIQTAIDETNERIPLADPRDKRKLELDLEILEKDQINFINQLEKLQS